MAVFSYHINSIDRRTLMCTRNEPIILITSVMFLLKEVYYIYPWLYFKSRHCSKSILPYLLISTFRGIRVYLQKTIHICRVNPILVSDTSDVTGLRYPFGVFYLQWFIYIPVISHKPVFYINNSKPFALHSKVFRHSWGINPILPNQICNIFFFF